MSEPENAERAVEIDSTYIQPDAQSDTDSAYAESVGSASYVTSLASSIRNYKYENGRRYHAYREGAYTLPNDEEEQDRMDLAHHIYLLALGGKLHKSPLEEPQRVLDLGTGTGLWAIEFADEYPSAQVIGTDLSAIQPPWVPPNLTFEIDDYETEWPFNRPFDYIHGREIAGFVSDYPRLFEQAFKNLSSGGVFELQTGEVDVFSDDNSMDKAHNTRKWLVNLHEASEKFGKPFNQLRKWKQWMIDAGFVDVREEFIKIPIGSWPKERKLKELGRFHQAQVYQAVGAYTPALYTRFLGWSSEEVEVICAGVRKEFKDRSLHLYQKMYFVYGRKP